MPYAPKPLPKSPPHPLIEYYLPLFRYLHREHDRHLRRALFEEPLALRRRLLANKFRNGERVDFEAAWDLAFPYLAEIESNLAKIVSRRSVAYWFYLYRRLAPFLSPDHDGKTDRLTTVLVREIGELAIVKHAKTTLDEDLIGSEEIEFETYLNGVYRKASTKELGSEAAARSLIDLAISRPQWVIGELRTVDFVDLYRIEGLSYEYWRTCATLRTIGKAVDVTWDNKKGWFRYHFENLSPKLFDYYDERLGSPGGLSTHFGTWFNDNSKIDAFDYLAWAQYSPGEETRTIEIPAKNSEYERIHIIPNFSVGRDNIEAFWNAHSFVENDFTARHGVSFSAVVFALWAISIHATTPSRFFEETLSEIEGVRILFGGEINLLRRGYTAINLSVEDIATSATNLAGHLQYPVRIPDREECIQALSFLTYSPSKQNEVALWAGGKRFPILPSGTTTLLDVAAVTKFIEGLFFRVGDVSKLKGPAFEQAARSFLEEEGFMIERHGRLNWSDGSEREIDASVRVGDALVILECVSAERPLDFEIGRPRTFKRRIEILSEKLSQAETVAERLRLEPVGRNFDFSWAKMIDWRVISPHHEFLWSEGPPCFAPDGSARLLDPTLALTFLNELKSKLSPA